jgi:hypothetical protein
LEELTSRSLKQFIDGKIGLRGNTMPVEEKAKKRLPRYKVATTPPPMRLTERDQRIVEWVYLFRFLTREHIHLLEFKDKSIAACQKRLTFLYHNGYLDAVLKPIPSGYGSSKRVYCLSERGRGLIAHMYDSVDPKEIKWKKSYNDVEGYFLEHILAINDVRVALTVATKEKCYTLEWTPEWDLKALKEKVEDPEKSGKYIAITPDSYFVIKTQGKKASFFLEADRATEANKRFKEKVRGYVEYVRTKKYQERYKTISLRVLVVTTTKERLKNLMNTTQSVNGASFFWFTTFKEANPENILSKPIWLSTGREDKINLMYKHESRKTKINNLKRAL